VAHLRAVRLLHANDVVSPRIEAGRHLDAQGRKSPYLVTVPDQELFGFAGLLDRALRRTAQW